jgi:hypothetical protein
MAFKSKQASEKQALETLGDTQSCLQLSTTRLSHTEQDASSMRVEYALIPGLSETTWKGCTIREEFASPQRSIRSQGMMHTQMDTIAPQYHVKQDISHLGNSETRTSSLEIGLLFLDRNLKSDRIANLPPPETTTSPITGPSCSFVWEVNTSAVLASVATKLKV